MGHFRLFAVVFLVLIFSGCGNNDAITMDSGAEMLLVDSPVVKLLSRTTMNDGTVDNLLDQADCFTLELPVVVRIGDEEYEIKTEEDLDYLIELLSGDHNKVTICHRTGSGFRTLEINVNAVQAHLNHGDSLGACEDEEEDDDNDDDDDEDDDDDDEDEDDDDDDEDDDDEDDDEDDDDDDEEDDDEDDDGDDDDDDEDEDDEEDVLVCHRTGSGYRTISINVNAVQAHLNHGDILGACGNEDDDKNATPGDQGMDDYKVELVYPVTIILQDYTRVTINNEAEMEAARAACEEGSNPDNTIECVDLKYPITVSVFDPDRDVSDTITFEDDSEVFLFIDALKASDRVTVQFPITLILADGSEVEVDSLEMLEQLLEANSAGCDQSGA